MRTWENGHLDSSISKVFHRLKPVLCNIRESNGSNDLVESKRGKQHQSIKMEDVIKSMQKQDEITTIDLLGDEEELEENLLADGIILTSECEVDIH